MTSTSPVPARNGLLALLGLYFIAFAVGMALANNGSFIGSMEPNEWLPVTLGGFALTATFGVFAGPFKRSTGFVRGMMIFYALLGVIALALGIVCAAALTEHPDAWRKATASTGVMTAVTIAATLTALINGAATYDPGDSA